MKWNDLMTSPFFFKKIWNFVWLLHVKKLIVVSLNPVLCRLLQFHSFFFCVFFLEWKWTLSRFGLGSHCGITFFSTLYFLSSEFCNRKVKFHLFIVWFSWIRKWRYICFMLFWFAPKWKQKPSLLNCFAKKITLLKTNLS